MNIKDSYIHNGTAVLKDVKVENSVLKKILAGKDANDAYLGWETVCDLTGIKPKAAGTADKVGHKLTFSGGVTGTWDGSADKTVAIPTKSSWNYDDVYLKLTGNGTTNPLTGTIYIKDVNGIILNSSNKDLNIWEVYGNSGAWANQYGFNLQYLGTGEGNSNDLILWAHNQTGTHVESYRVKQDGTFIFKATPKVGTNVMYHAGNLTIKTLMGTTAIGDSDEPVYWNGSSFVKAGAYPTKASWNYDDRYLKLAGGTMSNTNVVTNLNADLLDGYHASSFYQNKTLHSNQDSIYDLRFNYGQYNKGDFNGTYKDEYPTNYGSYIALTALDKNIGALMFFDAPTSNKLGHIYVRTRGAGNSNTTYSEWGTIAYLTDNVASSSKWVNARTITLTGSVTGSVSIDGSSDVTLTTTTNHTHTKSQITDFPTSLPANGGNADRAKFLETFHQNSTTTTYGAQYPIWAQWSDSANVRLKCTNYTVWTDKATTATTAITATKIGTSTVGSTTMPVYINSGTPTAISSFPEAYLSWGGKNFAGSYSPIDAAMISDLGACRSMFALPEGITIQYSRDGGATWVEYECADYQKTALFSVGHSIVIGGTSETGIDKSNYKSRVIVTTNLARIYTTLNKIAIYLSTNGSTGSNVTIDARTKANVDAGSDTWTTLADSVPVNGWSGWNIINIPSTTTYGNTSAQYQQIRLTFGVTSHASSVTYGGLSVTRIMMFGGMGWTAPSNMAKNGHLYSFDQSQNAEFPAAVRAAKFVKSGGTSAQFLKADGSVDSNTYSKSSHTHTFSSLTSKPTTISGYGITDALKIDGSNGTAAGVSALINKLDAGSSTPTDADYYICQYAGGETTNTTYYRRPMSAMWNWIKTKTDTLYPTKTGSGASGTWGISITGSAGSVAWSNITGKPSSFIPSSHTHSYTTIESCTTLDTNSDNFSAEVAGGSNSVTTKPSGVDAFGVIKLKTASGWYGQILLSSNTAQGLYYRTSTSLSSSVGWQKLLDSSNYNSYAPKLDGTGATGTWKINISGNAATATTATNLSKKPSIQVGTSDTKKITITAGGKTSDEYIIPFATASDKLYAYTIAAGTDVNTLKDFKYYVSNSTSVCASIVNGPTERTNGEMWFLSIPAGASSYGQQLYYSRQATNWQLWTRTWANNSFSPWVQFIHSGNISSQSVSSATTSTYASNVGSSGTAGTNYVTASKVISACNWYDTMIGSDSDTVINRWSEIVAFVAGFKETPDLATFLSNNYLAKAGGTMTGPLKWANATALPQQTSPQYFLCIDAFDDGGTTKWASKADTLKALTGLTSTAIGDSDEPVYWNGSKFVKAGAYPTKSSWNYDDRYLKLSGGTLSGDLAFSHGSSSTDQHITWSSGTNHQRLKVRDGKTDVFIFQYSTDSGATWSDYFTIQNGTAKIGSNTVYHSGNLPAYPTVNNGALYLQANGTTKVTFTANQSDNSTLNIATGSSNGTISVGGTNVSVKGLGSNAYSSTAYLPLAGGTMDTTAQIKREGRSGSWVGGRDRAIIRETSSSGYHPLLSLKTKDGSWELGEHNISGWYNVPIFSYVTDTDYSNGNNTTTYQIKYPLASGTIALTADLKWSNISSKPETATRWPSWSEVTNKPSVFPVADHNHDSQYPRKFSYTLPSQKGVRISYSAAATVLVNVCGTNSGAQLVIIGTGYGEGGRIRNQFTELVSCSLFDWSIPDSNSIYRSVEIFSRRSDNSNVCVISNGDITFTEINALTSAKENATLLNSSNYTTYTVTKTGSGASGTWGINITGSAGSVAWDNITGKPATATRWPSWSEVTDKPTFITWSETSSTASYSLSNAAWTNTITLPTTAGSYILNIVSGNSTLTGVFSIGASDNAKDEISLHLHGNGPRLYARTNGTTLQLSSNDASATSRSVTIKYRRMI